MKAFKPSGSKLEKIMSASFFIADYNNDEHANAIISLLSDYAQDPMGGGEPLPDATKRDLIPALAQLPGAFSVLGQLGADFVALANCLGSFSTFVCKPLINIHDLAVSPDARGHGLSQGLLSCVEAEAQRRGCCKVTLEVLDGNTAARAAYKKFGFKPYTLDDKTGHALFLQKYLS